MSWLSVNFETDAKHADELSSTLLQLGALSVDISDAMAGTSGEQTIFGEPGMRLPVAWQANYVSALFPADVDIPGIAKNASAALRLPGKPYTVTKVPDRDWVRLSQAQFAPLKISPRLWIVPTWHTLPDPDAVNVVLDPGLAFGTGSHPSTRLCLHWLDEHIRGGETVLDFGCGSGILSIAALKLGARRAFGVDSDRRAVLVSQANAKQNRVRAKFYFADSVPQIHADVVLANILADSLKLLAPLLAQATRPGGELVLSGILTRQAREVAHAYRDWFDFQDAFEDQGWVRLCAVKRLSQ